MCLLLHLKQNKINSTDVSHFTVISSGKSSWITDTKAAPQKILSKSTGQFCFSLPNFCIINILDRKCRCVHPRFVRTPPAEAALIHNRKRNGGTSVRDPHEVSTSLTKQQEQKKDDLLFLTVQFSSCGKKERGNFSFERTLIHKSGSRHFPLAHSQE